MKRVNFVFDISGSKNFLVLILRHFCVHLSVCFALRVFLSLFLLLEVTEIFASGPYLMSVIFSVA